MRDGKPINSINSVRLYPKRQDANIYLPEPARSANGITLEKVRVEITVLPPRRAR
jgi:hypothetical protein